MGETVVRADAEWTRVVEAAYAPASGDAAWVEQLVDAARGVFHPSALVGLQVIEHDAACRVTGIPIVGGLNRERVEREAEPLRGVVLRELYYPPTVVTTHLAVDRRLPPEARASLAAMRRSYRAHDVIALTVHPGPGLAGGLFATLSEGTIPTRREIAALTRLALHVEAGLRLRLRPEVVQAVIGSDGKVVRLGHRAPSPQLLRARVEQMERARAAKERRDAGGLETWSALVAGKVSLAPRTERSRRLYYVLENPPSSQPMRALTARELDVVTCASRGMSEKLIGYALGMSPGAVSSRLASAAAKLGLATRLELVRLAAMLTRDPSAAFEHSSLTTAERDVLELLSNGLSNREIAAIRNRSIRTVANQVAQLLRKTGSPTRRALIARCA